MKIRQKIIWIWFCILGNLVLSQHLNQSRRTAITQAIQKVTPAVVGINVIQIQRYRSTIYNDPLWSFMFPEQMNRRSIQSLGSGFIVNSDGIVYTNAHVVENAAEIKVTLNDGNSYFAKLIGIDELSDIAVLDIEGANFPYAELGDSEDIIVGELAIAIGNPFGLFDLAHSPTATAGIVSALNLDFGKQDGGRVYQEMIQTDASINSGNSGGPLVNANGEVIGMNTFIFTGGGYSQGSIGIGFAVPINRVKKIGDELLKHGKVDRSFNTGLSVQSVDRFLAQYLGLSNPHGVIITDIEKNSPGEKAGLKIGDVIFSVNNNSVNSQREIMNIIDENFMRAGDSLDLEVYRNRDTIKKQILLGETK